MGDELEAYIGLVDHRHCFIFAAYVGMGQYFLVMKFVLETNH